MSWSNCFICILLRYSIDRHTDLDRFFTINPEDGFIKTTKPLDREETAWLNISVFAAEIRKHSLLKVLFYFTQLWSFTLFLYPGKAEMDIFLFLTIFPSH